MATTGSPFRAAGFEHATQGPREAVDAAEVSGARTSPLSASVAGFAGRLRCATLADLVQLQCLARASVIVVVRSGEQRGELHFNNGDVVHAMLDGQVGNEAALEILSWVGGQFEMLEPGDAPEPSVSLPWQHLLLVTAQRLDEARRDAPNSVPPPEDSEPEAAPSVRGQRVNSEIVALKPPTPLRLPSLADLPSDLSEPFFEASHSQETQRNEAARSFEGDHSFEAFQSYEGVQCAVQIDIRGRVLAGHGDTERLACLCQFIRRVVCLIGDEFGFAPLRLFEGRCQTRHVLVYPKAESWVALQLAPEADIVALRQRLLAS